MNGPVSRPAARTAPCSVPVPLPRVTEPVIVPSHRMPTIRKEPGTQIIAVE